MNYHNLEIEYEIGDATIPCQDENIIIAHIVNKDGIWNSCSVNLTCYTYPEFVQILSNRYPEISKNYIKWAKDGSFIDFFNESNKPFYLCHSQFIRVTNKVCLVNMCCETQYASSSKPDVIDYDALMMCFTDVIHKAYTYRANIHISRIGLSENNWDKAYESLNKAYQRTGCLKVNVKVFDI